MSDQFWSLYGDVRPIVCNCVALPPSLHGLSHLQLAGVNGAVSAILFLPVMYLWHRYWPTFQSNGYSRPTWKWGLGLLMVAAAMPPIETLASAFVGPVSACPADLAGFGISATLVLAGLFCFELGRRHEGAAPTKRGYRRFVSVVALPLLVQNSLNSPKVGMFAASLFVRAVVPLAGLLKDAHRLHIA